MIPLPALRNALNGVIATIFLAQSANGINAFWNVDANGSWATVGSWVGGVPGSTVSTTSTDSATFNYSISADRTVTVDANRNIGTITFANSSSYKFTLSGGSLLLSNGGVIKTTEENGDHTDTINSAIAIQGNSGTATFTADAISGWSVLSIGAVTGVSTAGNTTTLKLNGSSSADNIITGVIGNGSAGGSLAVTKSGYGLWNLSGSNTFSGQLTVEDGILKVATVNNASTAGVLGNSALSVILGKTGNQTGTLEYTGSGASSTKRFTMASGSSGTFQVDSTSTSVVNLTLSGVIDGGGALCKTGAGTLTLSGTNTYTGGTILYTGLLNLGSAGALGTSGSISMMGGTLQFTSINKSDYSSRFSSDSYQQYSFDTNGQSVTLASGMTSYGGSLTKLGTGTLTLSGANTYDNGTTVLAGTLALTTGGTLGASTGTVTVDGTAGGAPILSLGTTVQTVGDVYLWGSGQITGTAGSGTLNASSFNVESGTITAILGGAGAVLTKDYAGSVTLSGANTYGGGTVVKDGTLTLSGSGTLGAATASLTVDGSAGGTPILALGATNQTVGAVSVLGGGQITGTGTLTATSFTLESGTFSVKLAGTGALTKNNSAGTVVLSGTNTYGGGTVVNAGILQAAKALSLPGQTTPGQISVANGGTLALNVGSTGEFAAADLTNVLTNASFVTGSTLALNATTAFAFSGSINGVLGLSKYGAGTVTLSGANGYTGGTTVTAGSLTLSGSGTLGATNGALIIDGGTANVNLGTTLQTVDVVTVRNGGTITGTGTLTGTAFNFESSGTISAKLAGPSAILTKSTSGSVTLSGANTYGGGTVITDGTLTVSIASALGANTGSVTVDGSGGGTPVLALGTTSQSVGTVNLSGGGQITGTGTLTATGFNLQSGSISANLAGASALLTKSGSGTVTLTGTSNTYGGGTHVDGGMLAVTKLGSLPGQSTPGLITVAGGATLAVNAGGTSEFTASGISNLLTNATFATNSILGINTTNATGGNFAYTQNLIGALGLTKLGTGTLTLSGSGNTYSGGTIVSGGSLVLSGLATLGTGNGQLVADGASTIVNLGGTSQIVGAVSLLNGAQINNGTLTGTSFQVNSGSISANLLGSGALLTKDTADTVTLTGANTYDGGVNLLNGVLVLGSSGALGTSGTIRMMGGTLQFTASNQTDYSNRFSMVAGQSFNFDTNGQNVTLASGLNSTGGSLTKSGTGSLILNGTNVFGGGININGGTLQAAKPSSLPGYSSPGLVTLADGTALAVFAGGSGEFTSTQITQLLNNVAFTSNTAFGINTSNGDFSLSTSITLDISLLKLGNNTLTLSGGNSYTGSTIIGVANEANAGTLRLSGLGTLGSAGPVIIYGGTLDLNGTTQSITTLTLGGGSAVSNATVTIGSGELMLGDNVTFVATNNPLGAAISGSGTGKLSLLGNRTFAVGDSSSAVIDMTISAIIQNGDATARNLTKTGTGTLLLTGANTYTGSTIISAGTLQAAMPAALPGRTTSGKISVAGGATISVNAGGSGEFGTSDIATLVSNATFASTAAVLGIDTTNAVGGTFTATNLNKTFSLSKLGTGTLILGTGNTYSGSTNVLAGTLQLSGALGTGGTITVATGGTFEVPAGTSSGRSVVVSGGLLNLTGTLGTGTTLTLADGTINALGSAATAATVVMPVPTATTILSAPAGQDLTVTSKLTQTVSNGYYLFTAGTPAFSVAGNNLASNVDKLTVKGGTTKIERYLGSTVAGLEVRAWQGVDSQIEGTMFDMPGSPTVSTSAGTVGYATAAIHFDGGEHFSSGTGGVVSGAQPTGYTANYTVEYRGKLRITTPGTYTFATTSDDGSALWIDPGVTNPPYSTAIVQNSYSQGMTLRSSAPISLTAGDHDIIVRYWQGGGGNGLYVQWDPAGGSSFVDIPGSAYFHSTQTLAAMALPNTELAMTATSTVNLGFAGAASLGNLTLSGASTAATFSTATSLSLDNITANDTASIAGPALSLRTGNVTVADTKTLTINPNLVDGTAATVLTKLGGGTLVLSGTNTYSGTTTVNAGILTLAGATSATGATILNGGTLTVTNANALQRSNVTFNGGILDTGALTSVPLGGITANVDTSVNSVLTTITGYPTWSAADTKTLTINGTITRTTGSAINFGNTGTITGAPLGTLLGINTINSWATYGGTDWALYDGSKIVVYSGYTAAGGSASAPTIATNPSANYRVDNSTTNNVTLATTGTIDINTLVLNDSTARTVDVRNGATVGTLRLGTAGAILLAGGSHTIGIAATPGTLTAGGTTANAAGDLSIMAVSSGTINSVIADNGTGKVSLSKNGTGTLTLTGANTYTGLTTVASGTLSLARSGGTLADTAPVTVSGGTLSVAQADTVGAVTLSIGTISGAGVLTGSSYAITNSGTISAVLGGTAGLTKSGAGTAVLTATNTYTGLTEVQAGTLTLGHASNTIANTAAVTVSGGTLDVANPDTVGTVTLSSGTISGVAGLTGSAYMLTNTGTISAVLAGSGVTLTKTGAGTVVLSGSNTYTGLTDVQAGTLSLARSGGTLANTDPVSVSGGILDVAQADTVGAVTLSSGTISGAGILTATSYSLTNTGTISAVLAGTGTFTKTGAGTVVLSATNTYTGLTTISGGTLSLGHASNTIGNTSAVTVSGGTLDVANPDTVGVVTLTSGTISGAAALTGSSYALTNTGTVSTVLAGVGTLIKSGTGTASLTAANTYTGITSVSAGVLRLDNANALPGGIGATGGTGGLTFSGGVVGLGTGNFTRPLNVAGTVGAVTFTGAGGWAAYGADRVVNLGGASGAITWATAGTGFNSQTVILGASTATNMVDLQNPIDLGAAARTVQVDDGAAAIDGKLSGILSGTGGGLIKTGTGTLVLTAANTYTGATGVSGGTLSLDFSATNPASILSSSTALTLTGGTLSVTGKASGTTSQTLAGLTINTGNAGRSSIIVNANGGGGTLLALNAITRTAGYIDFTLPTGTQSATNGITTSATLTNGILGSYATVGSNWASLSGTNIVPLSTYTDIAALGGTIANGATTNVRLNSAGSGANIALGAASTVINTLLQNTTTNATVDTASKTLQTTGIMLASGQGALTIGTAANSGFLSGTTAGGEVVLINNSSTNNLTINAVVQNNTSASPLATLGNGTVVLGGTNTFTGATTINSGRLTVASTGSINTTSGITIRGGELNYNSATALTPSITFSGTGGILSGTGTITPLVTVTNGNTLAPGNSIGTLTFGTGLTIAGNFAVQLGTPGTIAAPTSGLSDRTAVTGNLTLTNSVLTLSDNAGANSQGSAGVGAYRLMTFTGTRSGTFASVTNPLSATLHESVVYTGTSAGTVDLYLYRVAAANTLATPLNLGTFHVGGTAGTALSLTNTAAADGFSEKLSASIGSATGDAVVSGSFSGLAAQATNNTSLLAGFSTATVGAKSGSATITLSSDGTGTSGYGITSLGTQVVNLTGTVYSGLMTWSGAATGSWSASANWTDAQSASVHAAPGLDAGFTGVDTATFGSASGSLTVTLDGAAPSLSSLIFTNTGSYTIAKGSGNTGITLAGTAPAITVAGTHTISAGLALANNTAVGIANANDGLTVSGVISGDTMNLTKNGAGTLTLGAVNTYSGSTMVNGGKLTIAAAGSINSSSGITIQGANLNYNSSTALTSGLSFTGTGGTLSGTGTINPFVTIPSGNTLSPGNSVGTLTFGSGLAIAGTYAAQLGTPGPLATPANGLSDRAVVTGNLTLTNGILSLSDNAGANGQGSAAAGAYRLMTYTGTRTGTFASVTNPLSATLHEGVSYNDSAKAVDLFLYRLASASAHTPEPVNLGVFHVGATARTSLSLTNTAAGDGFSEKLSASIGSATGDAVVSGSFTQLAAQATDSTSLLAGVSTATVGNKSGTATITLSSDGTGTSGYGLTSLGTQTVNLTGTVYSGLMAWSGASGGAWGTNANWNDSQSASVHAAPGLDAGYTGVDTATFGNTAGSVTVNLNGAAPSLNALTFNSTGSYTIAQGSGSTAITLAGTAPAVTATGTHTISAPITLSNNVTVTTTGAADALTVSGAISGSGRNLTKSGSGTLTLSGVNAYTGTTTVTNGTLAIGAAGSLANTAVTVQTGGTLSGAGTIGGSCTIQGIAAPGGSGIALQTFSNSLALAATSHLQWQLADNLTTGRGTTYDGINVTGGTFAITPGATLDLSFISSVNFTNTFWKSNQTWTLFDLQSGLTGNGGTDLLTLGTVTGGGYSSSLGTFSVARVADANSKNDVVLKWTAATGGTSPYQTWIDSYSASIPSASDRQPGADPDHDGAVNLAEFAFDGVPNVASNKGLSFTQFKDNNSDTLKELTYTCAVRRSASVNFSANGSGAQTATIDEVTYVIEASTNLSTWTSPVTYVGKSDTAPAGSGLPSLTGTDWEYRTFSAFNGLSGKGFIRARVSMASSGTTSAFQTWIDGYSSSIPNANDRQPAADPDHDGANNVAEFAFDGVPSSASNKGLSFTQLKDNNADTLKELTYTCAVRRSASVNFSANGSGAQTATIDDVTYVIEASANLTTWTTPVTYVGKSDTAPAGSGLPSLAGTDWEYRTFSAFNGVAGKGFIRARVSMP